jgi:quercetin dioxygenase-like cupin family protein
MQADFLRAQAIGSPIAIPAIGLQLQVRIAPAATQAKATLVETTDAPGFGPPQHRHERETEVFHVLQGRYLFELDDERIVAQAGETIAAPRGSTHRFVNIDSKPSRLLVLVMPGLDAIALFTELRGVLANGTPEHGALEAFGDKWGVEFLGPPLNCLAQAAHCAA